MYDKCIKCDRLGKSCVPNLYVMPVTEIREFARRLKQSKGLTNAQLAALSGVPKGTIDANLAKKGAHNPDVTYTTFAPILCALLECDKSEMPCPLEDDQQKEVVKSQEERIKTLEKETEELKHTINKNMTDSNEKIDMLKSQLRDKKIAIVILAIFLSITVLAILTQFMYDMLNPNIGFFMDEAISNYIAANQIWKWRL